MSATNNNVITVQNEIPMVRLPVPENERQGGKGLSSLRSTFSLLPTLPESELIDIFHHNLTKKHWGTKLWRRCRQAGLLSYIGYSSFILFTILAITVSIIIVCLTSGKKKDLPCTLKFHSMPINFKNQNSNPRSIAIGNFNNDTFLDVVVANSNTNNIGVSLGIGKGVLASQINYSTGLSSSPYSVDIGDFNNDNRLDIVVANYGTHTIGIFIGDGNGSFELSLLISTGVSRPLSVDVGDLNNDKKLDLIIVNYGTNCIDIFLGQGDGNFSLLTTYFTGYDSIPYLTVLADFNNDSYLDIVFMNNGDNNIGVLLNNHNNSFSEQTMYSTGFQSRPYSLAVGDFDDDNYLDIIVSNSGTGNLGLFRGTGQGTFEKQQILFNTSIYGPSYIITADLNKDMMLDIVIVDYLNSKIVVCLGDKNLTFTNRKSYVNGFSTYPSSIITSDINNDNRLDILVTNYGTNSIGIYLGYDPGVFKLDNTYPTGDFSNPKSIVTADLNHDNQTDIIVGNNQGDNIGIFFGLTNGKFSNQTTYSTGSNSTPSSLRTIDLNNDQQLDIIIALSKLDSIGILFGNTNETFSSIQTIPLESGSYPRSISIGDFNNDHCVDFVVGKYNIQNIGLFFGYCNGTFTNQTVYSIDSIINPDVLDIADMNNDAYLDIIVVDSFASNFSIFFNQKNGTFRNQTIYTSKYGLSATSIAIEDIDHDQQLDLVIAYSLSNNIVIYFGSDNEKFDREVVYQNDLYAAPYSISINDLNNDNISDIIVANYRNDNVGIFLGFSNGTFDDQKTYSTGNNSGPWALTIDNVNHDNRLDIIVTYALADDVAILLGYDYGALKTSSVYTVGAASQPVAIAVHDFNHDGQLDLAIVDYGTEELEIRFGSQNGSFSDELTYSTGANSLPSDLALGDFNHDGNVDIVIANFAGNSISIFYGLQNGTFRMITTYSTGSNSRPSAIIIANINDDTWSDLVVTNSGTNTLSIFLGYQYTSLLDQITYSIDLRSHPIFVIVDDFDNDKNLDIVSSTDGQATGSVFLGYGNGTFRSPIVFSTNSFREAHLIASGYFDDDQCLDLVTVNIFQSFFSIFTGFCNGSFENIGIYSNVNHSYPSSMITGDFNYDNLSDIALAISSSNSIHLFFNQGNGTFDNQTIYSTGSGTSPNTLAKGDFDNDTYLDIAVTNYNASSLTIFFGNLNGSFERQINYSTGLNTTPSMTTLGDFNGDYWLDILIVNMINNQVGVLLATKNGFFLEEIKYSIQFIDKPSSLIAHDFNNDVILDIITTSSEKNTLRIYYGNNDGTFALQIMYTTGDQSSPLSLSIGDFNDDEQDDIVVANYGTSNIGVFLAFCCEPFLVQTTLSTGNRSVPQSVALGDLNNDKYTDLVVTNSDAGNIGIFLGFGDGSFTNQTTISTGKGTSPVSVALVDLNHDNSLDILVANYLNESIGILFGNENGTLSNVSYYYLESGSRPSSITVLDMYRNNKLDIIITDHGTNRVSILEDYENGSFRKITNFATGYQSIPYSIAYGDFNRDSMEDLVIALAGTSNIGFITKTC